MTNHSTSQTTNGLIQSQIIRHPSFVGMTVESFRISTHCSALHT